MFLKISTCIYVLFAIACSFGMQNMYANNDITKSDFIIDVWQITPGNAKIIESTEWWDGAVDRTNFALGYIIQRLMLLIGWVALFIMTIWSWFMILHRWDDGMLSKWKDIFWAGIIGLIIALCSYYIVALARFLIYFNWAS